MTHDKNKVEKLIAELLIALPGYDPLEIPKDSTQAMQRYALASMYKDKGFRDYLISAIRLNIERLQVCEDMRSLNLLQGRILVLKELLALSKQMFTEMEKLDKSLEHKLA